MMGDRSGDKLNILMEYVPGKSLDTLLEKFGPFAEPVIRELNAIVAMLSMNSYFRQNHPTAAQCFGILSHEQCGASRYQGEKHTRGHQGRR